MNHSSGPMFDRDLQFSRRLASLPDPAPKICACCGEVFSKRLHELRSTYHARKTCSQPCAVELKKRRAKRDRPTRLPRPRKQNTVRPCGFCGTPLEPREGEPSVRFAERRTCNRSCGARLRWTMARTGRRSGPKHVSDEEIDRRAAVILARMAA